MVFSKPFAPVSQRVRIHALKPKQNANQSNIKMSFFKDTKITAMGTITLNPFCKYDTKEGMKDGVILSLTLLERGEAYTIEKEENGEFVVKATDEATPAEQQQVEDVNTFIRLQKDIRDLFEGYFATSLEFMTKGTLSTMHIINFPTPADPGFTIPLKMLTKVPTENEAAYAESMEAMRRHLVEKDKDVEASPWDVAKHRVPDGVVFINAADRKKLPDGIWVHLNGIKNAVVEMEFSHFTYKTEGTRGTGYVTIRPKVFFIKPPKNDTLSIYATPHAQLLHQMYLEDVEDGIKNAVTAPPERLAITGADEGGDPDDISDAAMTAAIEEIEDDGVGESVHSQAAGGVDATGEPPATRDAAGATETADGDASEGVAQSSLPLFDDDEPPPSHSHKGKRESTEDEGGSRIEDSVGKDDALQPQERKRKHGAEEEEEDNSMAQDDDSIPQTQSTHRPHKKQRKEKKPKKSKKNRDRSEADADSDAETDEE